MFILVPLLLFGLPLFVFLNPVSFFEIPKVIVAETIIGILVIGAIFKGDLSIKKISKPGLWALGVLFGLSLIQLVLNQPSAEVGEMFWGNQFRLQGIFLLWILLVFSLVSSKFTPKSVWKIWAGVGLAGLLISCFMFGTNLDSRVVGSLGEPNSLATTVIFLLIFVTSLKKPIFVAIAGVVVIFMVFITGSRSGLISLTIAGLFMGLVKIPHLNLTRRFLICIFLVIFCFIGPFFQRQERFENRLEIWRTAFVAGVNAPIFGNGFGNVTQTLNKTSQQLQNNIRFEFIDSSHNIFLEYFLEGGLIGLGSFLVLIFLSIQKGLKKENFSLLSAWLVILVMFSFNPLSVVNLIELWWLIGQGLRTD